MHRLGQFLSILFVLILQVYSQIQVPPLCAVNTEYNNCGKLDSCQKTCEHEASEVCPDVCVRGCFCIDGYLWDNITNSCVPENNCTVIPECGLNEEYKECGKLESCQDTCQKNGSLVCPAVCKSGCFCKVGYLRDEVSGECFAERTCRCGANSTFKTCTNSQCTQTCQREKPKICTDICYAGCQCNTGYLLDETTGECVIEEECPDEVVEAASGALICEANEEYDECGTPDYCKKTCQGEAIRFCPAVCKPGCYCAKGFLRDEISGLCVPENLCQCGPNGTFSTCASGCRETCQRGKPEFCDKACHLGCNCDPGFIIDDETGGCIPRYKCTRAIISEPECGVNEEYKECEPLLSCVKTCQHGASEVCPAILVSRCACIEGYLYDNATNSCVLESECSNAPTCGANEEYLECGRPPSCTTTCQRNGSQFCPFICLPGCYCKDGYLKDEISGLCVPQHTCKCGPNSNFSICASNCVETCQTEAPKICDTECHMSCVCNPGFLLDEESNKCVPEDECEAISYPNCGFAAEYDECGKLYSCIKTCQHNGTEICADICHSACFCIDGFLWDDIVSKCVPADKCAVQPITTIPPFEALS